MGEIVETQEKEREERRSKMIMERTREGDEGGSGRGKDGGRGRDRGKERAKKQQPPPGLAPEEPEANTKPKLDEPRYISGLGPTRNQLKNKKRAQKRAKQRQQDEALDFLTTSSSAPGDVFSADDLLSSLGLDLELPPAPAGSSAPAQTYYKSSAGYNLRLDD